MSDRPTPKQAIVDFLERVSENPLGTPIYTADTPQELALSLLDRLAEHGYVIVHPDDVPAEPDPGFSDPYGRAWNNCRRHIFGPDR